MFVAAYFLRKEGEKNIIRNSFDKTLMKSFAAVGLAAALSLGAGSAYAQSHKLNISQKQMRPAERGWSVKKILWKRGLQ
jgi:hypothetical protein